MFFAHLFHIIPLYQLGMTFALLCSTVKKTKLMATQKNTPPKGVVIAVGLIVLMIILYFIFLSVFPDLFDSMSTGEVKPVNN
jgi:uncharacterized membrane protein (DUF485 family)